MANPISAEKLASLKSNPPQGISVPTHAKMTRIKTQFIKLPPNKLVRHIFGYSQPCTAWGCGAPSRLTFQGSPLCQLHCCYALVHELNRYSKHGTVVPDASSDSDE